MDTITQMDISNVPADILADIQSALKDVNWSEDDGSGQWYVVKKIDGVRAVKEDGTPIIVTSHETAYRIGYNIGLYDCLWWCPTRVEEYAQRYGGEGE